MRLGIVCLWGCVPTLLALSATADEQTQLEPEFVSIFNGRNLSGWDGREDCWRVLDGAIEGAPESGDETPNSWLIWRDGTLKNFHLKLKFRIRSGNSGVFYRAVEVSDAGRGYQAEVATGAIGTGKLHHGGGKRGAHAAVVLMAAAGAAAADAGYELVLEKAVGDAQPLSIFLSFRGGQVHAAFGVTKTYNQRPHDVHASGLAWKGDRLAPRPGVRAGPNTNYALDMILSFTWRDGRATGSIFESLVPDYRRYSAIVRKLDVRRDGARWTGTALIDVDHGDDPRPRIGSGGRYEQYTYTLNGFAMGDVVAGRFDTAVGQIRDTGGFIWLQPPLRATAHCAVYPK